MKSSLPMGMFRRYESFIQKLLSGEEGRGIFHKGVHQRSDSEIFLDKEALVKK